MIAGVLSTLEMHCLMKAGLCSGATESTWILDKLLVLSMEFYNRRRRADSTLSPTVKIYERKRQESVEWT